MASTEDHRPESPRASGPAVPQSGVQTKLPTRATAQGAPPQKPAEPDVDKPKSKAPARPLRKRLLLAAGTIGLVVAGLYLVPIVVTMLNTVSTDDAYVNGHVTFVA